MAAPNSARRSYGKIEDCEQSTTVHTASLRYKLSRVALGTRMDHGVHDAQEDVLSTCFLTNSCLWSINILEFKHAMAIKRREEMGHQSLENYNRKIPLRQWKTSIQGKKIADLSQEFHGHFHNFHKYSTRMQMYLL